MPESVRFSPAKSSSSALLQSSDDMVEPEMELELELLLVVVRVVVAAAAAVVRVASLGFPLPPSQRTLRG